MYYVNEHIKNCLRIFPEQGRYEYIRLDMNENPEGLPEDFVEEVKKEITPAFLATYPETGRFIGKYAEYLNIQPENICVTNGSDMAIRYILETFAAPAAKVVTVTPSFEMYGVNCHMLGLRHVAVGYDENLQIHIQEILDAIDEETDVVVLLNPNNPVGNVYSEQEARAVIEKASACNAVVVIDEAYHYFYPKTFLNLVSEYDNVILLRTFSKLCSIAGLRLGIVVSNPQIIGYLVKARPTFDTNAVALLFGERILDHPELFDRLAAIEMEGRNYTRQRLEEEGYEYFSQNGNFFFIRPRRPVAEVKEELHRRKILVKTYSYEVLKKYIRISTGSRKIMELFMDAFLEVDNR